MVSNAMANRMKWFAIKADVRDLAATSYAFIAQKTMYGGKNIAVGDPIFIFASENDGGNGLFARGVVSQLEAVPRSAEARRETPRISIGIDRNGSAKRSFGRMDVRSFRGKISDDPEAEVDFKLYRQATNKVVGLTDQTGKFLNDLF